MQCKNVVVLGLGSNLGDTKKNILDAFRKIPLREKCLSAIIKTNALLTKDAPREWNLEYCNAIVIGKALFEPLKTFAYLKKIEKQMKRIKIAKYSPRTIDIDILFWGNATILEKHLRVPHKEVLKRYFTLKPLSTLVPLLLHPISKISVRQALLNYYRTNRKFDSHRSFSE